jgi:hypothetical protein
MPVEVSTVQSSSWRLDRRFGTGYAIISHCLDDGSWVSAPVVLGAFLPYDGYRYDIEHYLDRTLQEGEYIQVVNSGVAIGYNSELAVVEVSAGDGATLTEAFIRRGWAIPAEEVLAYHRRRQHLIEACRDARQNGAGMWRDDAWLAIHEEVLSDNLLARIGPQAHLETRSFTTVSVVVAIVVLMLVGIRLWYYSQFVAPSEQRPSSMGRWLLATSMEAFGLRAIYHRADYLPVPGPESFHQVGDEPAAPREDGGEKTS